MPQTTALRAFYQSSDAYEASLARVPNERYADYAEMLCRVSAPGERVLDAGCGAGQALELLAAGGRRAFGVDVSHRFLCFASGRGVPVGVADLVRLPFPNGTFAAVGFYQVIEHLPDVAAAIRELLRVTRPGGALVTYAPNYFSLLRNRTRAVLAKRRGSRPPQWLLTGLEAVNGAWVSLGKAAARRPRPRYVQALLGADWRGTDYDIVAAIHPLDVVSIVHDEGCEATLHPSPSDSRFRRLARRALGPFGPGWWLVARKPSGGDASAPARPGAHSEPGESIP